MISYCVQNTGGLSGIPLLLFSSKELMIQTVHVGHPCRVPSCRIACDQWVGSSVQVFVRRGLPWGIGRGKNLTCERTWENSGLPVLLDLDLQFKVSRLLAFLFLVTV